MHVSDDCSYYSLKLHMLKTTHTEYMRTILINQRFLTFEHISNRKDIWETRSDPVIMEFDSYRNPLFFSFFKCDIYMSFFPILLTNFGGASYT